SCKPLAFSSENDLKAAFGGAGFDISEQLIGHRQIAHSDTDFDIRLRHPMKIAAARNHQSIMRGQPAILFNLRCAVTTVDHFNSVKPGIFQRRYYFVEFLGGSSFELIRMREHGDSARAHNGFYRRLRIKASLIDISGSAFAQVAIKGFLSRCDIPFLNHHPSEMRTTHSSSSGHALDFFKRYVDAERPQLAHNFRITFVACAP